MNKKKNGNLKGTLALSTLLIVVLFAVCFFGEKYAAGTL